MAHVRTRLRRWLKAALAGSPDAADRVFVQRALPLAKALLPTLLLSMPEDQSEDMAQGGKQWRRQGVRIVGCCKGDSEQSADLLDRLAAWVEGVFSRDPTLGGLAKDYAYRGSAFEARGDGEQTLSVLAIDFEVSVWTRREDPETAL